MRVAYSFTTATNRHYRYKQSQEQFVNCEKIHLEIGQKGVQKGSKIHAVELKEEKGKCIVEVTEKHEFYLVERE